MTTEDKPRVEYVIKNCEHNSPDLHFALTLEKQYSKELKAELEETMMANAKALVELNRQCDETESERDILAKKLAECEQVLNQPGSKGRMFLLMKAERDELKAKLVDIQSEIDHCSQAYQDLGKLHFDLQKEHDQLREQNEKLKKALESISELFITVDSGRFGAFVSADAVAIARQALAEARGENDGQK